MREEEEGAAAAAGKDTMAGMRYPLRIYIVSARVHTLYLGPGNCFSVSRLGR